MKIHLEYTAVLKCHGPASGSVLELPDGGNAAALLDLLGIARDHQRHITVAVNAERVRLAHVLQDGDRVFLSVPMSGG